MSLCDSCRQPGACCSGFILSNPKGAITHWDSFSREDINADIEARTGWPFRAIAKSATFAAEENGQQYNTWFFGCPALGEDGRCTRYEERPQLCRDFQAGSTPLCVEHVPGAAPAPLQLKGIPIVFSAGEMA